MSSRSVTAVLALLLATLIAGLSAQTLPHASTDRRHFLPDFPLWRDDDMQSIAAPAEHDLSKSYEFVANTFGDTARSFGPALNVNTLGEVPDSSWFTNRIGRQDMFITPKFTIRDGRGDTCLIKLDPASNPEVPSSVELISTKLFHAIGYHVPQDYVVHFRRDDLLVASGARMRNAVDAVEPRTAIPSDAWPTDLPAHGRPGVRETEGGRR
jgi:hypothetical protein